MRVSSLYVKPGKGQSMVRANALQFQKGVGIAGSFTVPEYVPRQVTIGFVDNLQMLGVSPVGARCNVLLEGAPRDLTSGTLAIIGEARLRITLPCEPCTYGAQLAQAPVKQFRRLERYLALVVDSGCVQPGMVMETHANAFECAPSDFRERCQWALDRIPPGRFVNSLAFLAATGMSSTYGRVLPRWMMDARRAGKPVHRVLTQSGDAPSWCEEALTLLTSEVEAGGLPQRSDLTKTLHFLVQAMRATMNL